MLTRLKRNFRGRSAVYLDPYRRVVESAGPCFEALLWRNRESQTERFRVIAESIDLSGRVVADLGCGRADLAWWLAERGIGVKRYIGVDAVEEMVSFSRERAAGPDAFEEIEIVRADFAEDRGLFERLSREFGVDCFVFSGSLNTMDQGLAEAVLERAWGAALGAARDSSRGPGGRLVFNFLSDRDGGPPASEDEQGPARRFSTVGMVRWALDRSTRVVFRHDYLRGQDATIAMS